MLKISKNSVENQIDLNEFNASKLLKKSSIYRLSWIIIFFLLGIVLIQFLPWTQNINAKGYVTTRQPQQRPQAVQSIISGKLEKWFVQEGDYVNKGDTIIFISEIKSEYFDPNLIERTNEQVSAKSQSIQSYDNKVQALEAQYKALLEAKSLKIQQTLNKIIQIENKINIDSIDLVALELNYKVANNQLERIQELYNKGLKSLSELQEKELKNQELIAKINAQKNKLVNQRNNLEISQIELKSIDQEYADKLSKSLSDKQSALSSKLQAMANTSKLKNQLSNYSLRQEFYYVKAPQSGYITKTMKKGIGEVIKEGTDILTIVPKEYDLAVEVYIKPQDIPLLTVGNSVTLRFDGWPAIVISGWPESSTGLFKGNIVAIDKFISENGNYRILISPADYIKDWPEKLSIGTGVSTFILLKEVPIWYEIWRQLNGFPADFYQEDFLQKDFKSKAPLKKIK